MRRACGSSDGYIYFAILKYGCDDTPNLGEGPSTTIGFHHIGFYVDDLEESVQTIEEAGSTECPGSHPCQPQVQGPPRRDDRPPSPGLGRADSSEDAAVRADACTSAEGSFQRLGPPDISERLKGRVTRPFFLLGIIYMRPLKEVRSMATPETLSSRLSSDGEQLMPAYHSQTADSPGPGSHDPSPSG